MSESVPRPLVEMILYQDSGVILARKDALAVAPGGMMAERSHEDLPEWAGWRKNKKQVMAILRQWAEGLGAERVVTEYVSVDGKEGPREVWYLSHATWDSLQEVAALVLHAAKMEGHAPFEGRAVAFYNRVHEANRAADRPTLPPLDLVLAQPRF